MEHRPPPLQAGSPTEEADLQRLAREHFGRLRILHGRGAQEHAPLPLGFEVFSRRALESVLARTRATDREGVDQALARLVAEDFYLGTACEEGVAGAWDVLLDRYLPRLRGLLKHHGASEAHVEELLRELPGDLTTPPPRGSARTRLGTYEGTASLFSWLAVIAHRRLADRLRAPARPFADPERTAEVRSPSPDPADLVLEQETVRHFGEALRVAWRRLTPREALALAFKFRHGLPQRTVARLLGVGEARVSRLVHAGVEKVKAALQEGSAADPGETWADRGRCWTVLTRVVREHLQSAAGPSDSPKERSGT